MSANTFTSDAANRAWDIKFNPAGTRAYICGPAGSGDVVNGIDTSTYTVIARIPVGFMPKTMIVSPSGRHIFVANFGSDTITQIDTATNKVVRNITVGKKPHGFQILPWQSRLTFALNQNRNKSSRISAEFQNATR